jgi:hypothetical protein
MTIEEYSKAKRLICFSCGEIYALKEFSKKDPLEICGECGCEFFIPYSRNYLRGYLSLEHYCGLIDLLPNHLKNALPANLYPSLSPFVK